MKNMKLQQLLQVQRVPKNEVRDLLRMEMSISFDYVVLLSLSIMVSTMGLVMNNTAIIIGSMILSPLLWPVLGLALGTVEGERKPLISSLITLIVSILLTLLLSYLLGLVFLGLLASPTEEMLLRSQPNLLDLAVALVVGFAAPLMVIWKKFSSSAAGVAVAASLLPPLTVTGMGLAMGLPEVAWGSFLLFFTNLASMLFAGIILLFIAGYRRKKHEERATSVRVGIYLTFATLLIIGIQLFFPLYALIQTQAKEMQVKEVIASYFKEKESEVTVESLSLYHLIQEDGYSLSTVLRSTNDIRISLDEKKNLEVKLASMLGERVLLDIRLLPSLTVVTADVLAKEGLLSLKGKVESLLLKKMAELDPSLGLDTVDVRESGDALLVSMLLRVPEKSTVSEKQTRELEKGLSDDLARAVTLDVQIVRVARAEQQLLLSPEETLANEIYEVVTSYTEDYFGFWNVSLEKLRVAYDKKSGKYNVMLELHTDDKGATLQSSVQSLKNHLFVTFSKMPQEAFTFQVKHYSYDQL